jgi:cytochrome b6-f complex iron-sulfur subunit
MAQHARLERRCFLRVLAAGGAAATTGLTVGCGSGPGGTFSAGNVSDLPVGTLRAVASESVAIGRDADGVYAMSLICTHGGCDMASYGNVSATEVYCSCHGSVFDTNGNAVSGPARGTLEHFSVAIDAAGEITVDADKSVPASQRAPVA